MPLRDILVYNNSNYRICTPLTHFSRNYLQLLEHICIYHWIYRIGLYMFLGAFAKLRKVTTSFIMSVRPSAWNNSSLTGRIFMKFDISGFFENLSRKIQASLKSNNNNRYFTWRPIYIFDHISLSSYYNEKCFTQKLYRKSKHTFCVQ